MYHRSVCLVAVGGTVDKLYPDTKGSYAFQFPWVPAAVNIAARARTRFSTIKRLRPAMDSLDMKDADRERVQRACLRSVENAVVVTHGTDTMIKTAAVVALRSHKKTIIFTGAAQPERMKETDADFNIGFASCAAQVLPPGVYIAMNGRVFPHDQCRKNDNGTFSRKRAAGSA